MSLINPRNFLSPFTNAINLATIIVIALLFGIYRLSGGGVNMSSRKAVVPVSQPVEAPKAASSDKSQAQSEQELKPNAPRPATRDRVLGDLLDNESKQGSLRDPPKRPAPANPNSSSLDDIARQLGVE